MDKNNQPRLAAALHYDEQNDDAPRVVASGRGITAENIIQAAVQAGVVVKKDCQLARTLVNLEIGQVIPPELYTVIAEILAFVYKIDRDNNNDQKHKV